MFQEPQQGLTNGTEFQELAKHRQDSLLHAAVRVFLPMFFLGLYLTEGCGHQEFAAPRFFPPRFDRALAQ